MKVKKFFEKVREYLDLEEKRNSSKKKYLKTLCSKLEERKEILIKQLEESSDKKQKKALKEDLSIVKMQIKKGEKLLDKLKKK